MSGRAKDVLELVYSNIYGQIKPPSNGGKNYLITFNDGFSRKTWVYILQNKSEASSTFKSFKACVENEARKTIQTLRTDHGGEYCSKEFEAYCEHHGHSKRAYNLVSCKITLIGVITKSKNVISINFKTVYIASHTFF